MAALKAEYGVGSGVLWHIVPDTDDGWALCHRLLSSIAERRPITGLGAGIEADHLCQRCREAFESGTAPMRDPDASEAD